MASKRQTAAVATAATLRLAATWLQGQRRNALLALAAVGVLAYAAVQTWKQYGATHAHWETYTLAGKDLKVTAPPPWVHGNVKEEVVRLGSLERLSILDRDTSREVAQAFSLHPWVAKVHQVSKRYPAEITVEIAYRRPVAVVEVEHQGQPGLLPIDREGVLLPPEDFSVGHVKELPRIAMAKTFPTGPVGTPWGDDRIASAALVAEVLCDDWAHTPLFQIVALPALSGGSGATTSFELVARDGRRFLWGRAPGQEASGEKTPSEKRSRLFELLKKPAESGADQAVDLRT